MSEIPYWQLEGMLRESERRTNQWISNYNNLWAELKSEYEQALADRQNQWERMKQERDAARAEAIANAIELRQACERLAVVDCSRSEGE